MRIRQNIISTIIFSTVLEVPKANPFPSSQSSKPLLTSTHYDRTASGVHRFSHPPHSSLHETAYPVSLTVFFRVTKFVISLPLPITVLLMFANVFQPNYSKILLHDASLYVATRPFDLCWKALKKGHGTDIGPLLTDTENALYYDYIIIFYHFFFYHFVVERELFHHTFYSIKYLSKQTLKATTQQITHTCQSRSRLCLRKNDVR